MSTPAPNVLVVYGSKHGATREIGEAIAHRLEDDGLNADCASAADVDDLGPYNAVVLGSAVYMGRWRREARRFLAHHRKELAERPVWLFSSGPIGTDKDPQESEPRKAVREAERLDARDHVVFPGRVPLHPRGRIEQALARSVAEDERDARDWGEIERWADTIAHSLGATTTHLVEGG
jgi:menaquinone-dependent protoporphyrinogen oxidase